MSGGPQTPLYQAFSLKLALLAELQSDPTQQHIYYELAKLFDQNHEQTRDQLTAIIGRGVILNEDLHAIVRDQQEHQDDTNNERFVRLEKQAVQLTATMINHEQRLSAAERSLFNDIAERLQALSVGLSQALAVLPAQSVEESHERTINEG